MTNKNTANYFDKQQADSYDERWAALAPFNESLHMQLGLILGDLPEKARILCVGAGTGAELLALAKQFPQWSFLAVDPSLPMLEKCREKAKTSGISDRCNYHAGHISDIPDTEGAFDAATSILVSHFIVDRSERLRFFQGIRNRLRPEGFLITSDLSEAPRRQQQELMQVWIRMMKHMGANAKQVEGMLAAYDENVAMLSEENMESLLEEAGFEKPTLFTQSLLIRSWFARASSSE